jgi:hypothetical protein
LKIGDVFEFRGSSLIVLTIERFEICSNHIIVYYTCQNLNKVDFISKKKAYKEPFQLEFESRIKYDDNERFKRIYLGRTIAFQGEVYKIVEFTDISLDSTDFIISLIARPIYPIDRKEAKAKLFSEKRKKLQLEVL